MSSQTKTGLCQIRIYNLWGGSILTSHVMASLLPQHQVLLKPHPKADSHLPRIQRLNPTGASGPKASLSLAHVPWGKRACLVTEGCRFKGSQQHRKEHETPMHPLLSHRHTTVRQGKPISSLPSWSLEPKRFHPVHLHIGSETYDSLLPFPD